MTNLANTLAPGTMLFHGNYKIVRAIGRGGFGITYQAINTSLNKTVAIKEFFPKGMLNRDADSKSVFIASLENAELIGKLKAKFVKEARRIAELHHDSIVAVSNAFEEDGTAYYVMDYVDGQSLDEMVKNAGPLSVRRAVGYIKQVAGALDYLHRRRINHLDIKPANMLVDRAYDRVLLIDFGLSKKYDSDGRQTSTTPVGVSHGYAPVEQYRPDGVGEFCAATDIYSLGASLYFLLTGVRPPSASALEDEVMVFPPQIPDRLQTVIQRAMARKKSDRYGSVAEFIRAIDSGDVRKPVTPAKPRRSWGKIIAFLFVAVVVGGVAYYLLNGRLTLSDSASQPSSGSLAGSVENDENEGEAEVASTDVPDVISEPDAVTEVKDESPSEKVKADEKPTPATAEVQLPAPEPVKPATAEPVKPTPAKVVQETPTVRPEVEKPKSEPVTPPKKTAIGSSSPRNLDLAVKDSSGKTVFVSVAEWKGLSDAERASVTKTGICLVGANQRFVLSLRNQNVGVEGTVQWSKAKTYRNSLPTKEQAEIILANLAALRTALSEFAQKSNDIQPLAGWYWTQTEAGDGRMWCLNVDNKKVVDYPQTVRGKVRLIVSSRI